MAEGKDTLEKSVEDLEKEITCAICHDHYTDPKVLPCCHYYCKQCIHSLTLRTGINRPFSCPECRKSATLPEGDVENLPTAFFINRMKAMYSNMERAHGKVEAKCEMCSGDKSEAFCRQCAMFICAECVKQHQKLKVFAGHKTSTLEELKEGGAKDSIAKPIVPTCKLHEEPMKYYCPKEGCACLVCRDCIMFSHNDHSAECKPIKSAAREAKERLIQHLAPLKRVQENLMNAVEQIIITETEVDAQGQSVTRDIENHFEELHMIIESRKQEMLEEATARVSKKLECLSAQRKDLSMSSAVVQSVIDYTEQCVEHSADDEVLSMHAEIQSRIDKETEEQQKEVKNLEPVEEANVGVEVTFVEDLKQLCKTKAEVVQLSIAPTVTDGFNAAEVNKVSKFSVITKLSNGTPTKQSQVVECCLKRLACGSVVKCKVETIKPSEYCVQYTPKLRGRHELTVTVNGQAVAGSPFPVFVSISPTQLGKPLRVISQQHFPTSIAITPGGELAVSVLAGVIALNKAGERLRNIELSGYRRGITVDENGNIYFFDNQANKLCKFDKLMQPCLQKDVSESSSDCLGIAVVGDKIMACAKKNKGTIEVFNSELECVNEIATKNCSNFKSLFPGGNGNLYVVDGGDANCVRIIHAGGGLVRSFCRDSQGVRKLQRPLKVCVSGQYAYVSDCANHNIVVFTTDGQYVTSFGKFGRKEGEFDHPFGLRVDNDGFLYVCDSNNHRIQVF